MRATSIVLAAALVMIGMGGTPGADRSSLHSPPQIVATKTQPIFGIPDPSAAPGNAHRMIVWASYEKLVKLTDAQLDMWKDRGVDGFVVQTRYLDEIGGSEHWTGDPNDPLNVTIIEGTDVHERQRTLRDIRFAQRCHARGMTVYLGLYLSNYHNLSTPLKVWNDDAGWAEIIPMVRGVAGAAKLLGMDGIATDSENYRSESQTWNWNYPGATQSEATVRGLARQRGQEFMDAVLAGFPQVVIINYRIEIPGDWEERVQLQVNKVTGVWDKSVFPDFWGGIADRGGFAAIHFLDPIFYKSWHIGSGWDAALEFNIQGVRKTLSQRWANWEYAGPRFFLSPFAWIDPGPSPGSFDDARPVDYVARQLEAFHKWGEGNLFGLYTQHIDDFDYTPYVPAMRAASTPDAMHPTSARDIRQAGRSLTNELSLTGIDRRPAPGTSLPATVTRLERVAAGLREPTDVAFSPDGRLFITERGGGIRVVRGGGMSAHPAVMLSDVWIGGGAGLLAIAIDPQFDRNHFVYVIYTTASRSGEATYRLARFREVNDTLGERAILLDAVPAARTNATASLRFGPDGKMYAAIGAGADPRQLAEPGSYNGKILRLNPDGTTPSDQPIPSPVYAYGYGTALGLDWQSGTGALWVAGRDLAESGSRLRLVRQNEVRSMRGTHETSYVLPRNASDSRIAFYRGTLIPSLRGHLLVASAGAPAITRIAFEGANPARVSSVGPLLRDAGGDIRALAISPEGAVYLCVNNEVMRLVMANR